MNPDVVMWLLGALGFGGFEALRVYKRLWAGHNAVPQQRPVLYMGILAVLALFSGSVGWAVSAGSAWKAVFAGFSVPSGLKAVMDPPGEVPKEKVVDDHDLGDMSVRYGTWRVRLVVFIRDYFGYM